MATGSPLTVAVQADFVHNIVRMCQLISTTVTLYDHLISFDQEVQLVWNKPWSIGKAMFLWIRYFGSLFIFVEGFLFCIKPPSHQFCRMWFILQAWGTAIIIWSMQYVMLYRTFAMYHHCRKIVIPCSLCFAAEVLSIATIFIVSFRKLDAINEPFPGVYICKPRNVGGAVYAFWIPIVALDCVLLVLAIFICIRRVQSIRGLNNSRNHMWKVLFMDNLLYFSVTVLTYVVTGVGWILLPPRWRKLPEGFSVAGTCVLGTRLILNLRKAYYTSLTGGLTS